MRTAWMLLPLAACAFDPRGVPPSGDDDGGDSAAPDARPDVDAARPDAAPPDAVPPPDARLVECPDNYGEDPGGGLRLRFDQSSNGTWLEAVADCADDAAPATFLAIATDDATNAAIDDASGNRTVWIGVHDRDDEGEYVTIDGDAIAYDRWGFGEPNDGINPQPEDCVELVDGGDWNDADCAVQRRYVCACDPTRSR